MSEAIWSAVDAYFDANLLREDDALRGARRANAEAGLPAIDVSAGQGAFFAMLADLVGARRILEIGTLGGYSTIWLARTLPADGRLTTLEVIPKHAEVATRNIENAGLADRVEVLVGPAAESLARLEGPFDFVFVDADKANNPTYWREARRLTRSGGVIVVDNVVRGGEVTNTDSTDPNISGIRTMIDAIRGDEGVRAVALQNVGAKGYDGFLIARVL